MKCSLFSHMPMAAEYILEAHRIWGLAAESKGDAERQCSCILWTAWLCVTPC